MAIWKPYLPFVLKLFLFKIFSIGGSKSVAPFPGPLFVQFHVFFGKNDQNNRQSWICHCSLLFLSGSHNCVFRSARVDEASEEDIEKMKQFGIKTIIDLRASNEFKTLGLKGKTAASKMLAYYSSASRISQIGRTKPQK